MLLVSHVRAGGSRIAVDMEETMRNDYEPGVPVVRLHLKLIAMACGAAFTVLVFILLLEMFFG